MQEAEETGDLDAESIDPNECLRTMDDDWTSDSDGKPALECVAGLGLS
jgi:hypothetical protein